MTNSALPAERRALAILALIAVVAVAVALAAWRTEHRARAQDAGRIAVLEAETAALRKRLDESELARLYLRDQATREGWLETPRYCAESRALGQEFLGLRDEFDEDLYDWALFSTGHPNCVAVAEVLSGSAAQSAGLQPGDVIVRYDDRLVLSASELRDATLDGRAGELVAVEVQRAEDPAPLRVFVPRGPPGVRMTPTRETPPPAG